MPNLNERRTIDRRAIFQEVRVAESDLQDEWALRQALAKIERRSDAKQLFFSWPNLHPICLRLASFCTNLFPSREGAAYPTYLEMVLDNAFLKYDQIKSVGDADEIDAMTHFLAGLFVRNEHSLADYSMDALVDDVHVRWNVASEPIAPWLRRIKAKKIVFANANPSLQRRESTNKMLATWVLGRLEQERLFSKFENQS